MKTLLSLTGGYPRQQDYILALQTEMLAMGNSILGSISFDVILSGCAITNNNDGTVSIAAGMVYVNGQILRFDGASNVNANGSKSIITGSAVTSGPLVFNDTSTKNAYSEVKAVIGDTAESNARQLVVGLTILNLETYIDLRIAASAPKGTIRELVFDDPDDTAAFLAKFDDTGLGVTVDWFDWQLMNGNNGPDATGRVTIGVGTITDTNTGAELVIASGDTGGEVTHKLLPAEVAKFNLSRTRTDAVGTEYESNKIKQGTDRGLYTGDAYSIGNDVPHNNMQPWLGVFKVRKFR
jgi:hypothetical protein